MKIRLSPQRCDAQLHLAQEGDTLFINEEPFDFSQIPEGATLPCHAIQSEWIVSDVLRKNGELCLTLLLPHGASAPDETLSPATIITQDGEVPLPPFDAIEETPNAEH